MSHAQQEVVALEASLPALRQDYEQKGRTLRDVLPAGVTCGALQDFHDAGLSWFNQRARLIAVGSLTGADKDPTWYTYQAETALNLMDSIPGHFEAVFAAAHLVGLPPEAFRPSPTSFSELQRLVASAYPQSATASRARFAGLGLPTVGFDMQESSKSPASLADLLLVTVNENETRALLKAVEGANGVKPTGVPLGDRVYRDLGVINGTRIFHALSEMGSGGPGASQQTVDKALRDVRPRAVVAVGVAFGVNAKKQVIGDILVSRQLWLYDLQRVGKEIRPRGDKPHGSTRLINFFDGTSQTTWAGARVRSGVLLTGEKLIDNVDYRAQLLQFESEAIGGEMEGAGVYVSSHDHKAEWIVIKAICDWADGNKGRKKQERQQIAAANACAFLIHALQQASLKAIL